MKVEHKIFFKEQFYLNEFEKITWCNDTEQKYGTVSDLIIADYEKLFKNTFHLKSKLVDTEVYGNSSIFSTKKFHRI